ncbi:hypothetical protein P152DRAFT_507720, partial [Eremomyces bilateralis CBS 781.70]
MHTGGGTGLIIWCSFSAGFRTSCRITYGHCNFSSVCLCRYIVVLCIVQLSFMSRGSNPSTHIKSWCLGLFMFHCHYSHGRSPPHCNIYPLPSCFRTSGHGRNRNNSTQPSRLLVPAL